MLHAQRAGSVRPLRELNPQTKRQGAPFHQGELPGFHSDADGQQCRSAHFRPLKNLELDSLAPELSSRHVQGPHLVFEGLAA